jgi:hypothetical protein
MLARISFFLLIAYCPFVAAQNYLQYEIKASGRQCGYPGRYTVDMSKIYETANKYYHPVILLVTPEERTKVEAEIKQLNEQGEIPRKGMDPCSTCSQEYEACIVFDYRDANVSNCSTWKEWRDDWDQKVLAIIDDGLSKNAWMDPNSYTLNFKLQVGPDGKVTRIEFVNRPTWNTPDPQSNNPPWTQQDINDFAQQGLQTLNKMSTWFQNKFSKLLACPFPKDSKRTFVDRTPSIYHNVPGQVGHKPSPIPTE